MKEFKFVFFLLSITLAGFVIQCVLNMYLARYMGNYFYGEYSVALQLLYLLVTMSLFGTDIGAMRFFSKYLESHQNTRAQDYLAWNLKVVSISFLASRLLALGAFVTLLTLHILGIYSIHQQSLFLHILWITPIAASFVLLSNFLYGKDLVFCSLSLNNIVNNSVQFLFFFIALQLFKCHIDDLTIAIVLGGSYLLLSVLAFIFLKKDFWSMLWVGLLQLKVTHVYNASWFHRSSQLNLGNMTYFITISLDIFVVKLVSKDTVDVGYYAAIMAITSLFPLLSSSLYYKLKPTISHAMSTPNGRSQFQLRLKETNILVFVILTTLGVLTLCFSTQLLFLFGPDYVQAKPALIYTILSGWLVGLSQFSSNILLYAGFEELACRICYIRLACMLLFIVPATYLFGISGTVIAKGMVFLIFNGVFIYFVKRKTGIHAIFIPGWRG